MKQEKWLTLAWRATDSIRLRCQAIVVLHFGITLFTGPWRKGAL